MVLRLIVYIAFAGLVVAQTGKLTTVPEGPPESIAASIREVLPTSASRVALKSGLSGTFWIRENLEMAESASSDLGVNFGQFSIGTLVGVAQFSDSWMDYKNTPVKAGTYTLRYARQPADGDHLGVSLYRDFLILGPAAEDTELIRELSQQDLIDLGRLASGNTHPAVLGFFPIWDGVDSTAVVSNELDQMTLAVKNGDVTLGLVLIGHGE
jgi:hypothetical protein